MYYLLENNRIIDSENYKEPYILSKDIIRNREVLFLTSFKDQVLVQGPIKKQSENVFDLIDWKNDLVRVNDRFYGCDVMSKVRRQILEENNYLIDAIYKPNSNGDYIKVWEKKD